MPIELFLIEGINWLWPLKVQVLSDVCYNKLVCILYDCARRVSWLWRELLLFALVKGKKKKKNFHRFSHLFFANWVSLLFLLRLEDAVRWRRAPHAIYGEKQIELPTLGFVLHKPMLLPMWRIERVIKHKEVINKMVNQKQNWSLFFFIPFHVLLFKRNKWFKWNKCE